MTKNARLVLQAGALVALLAALPMFPVSHDALVSVTGSRLVREAVAKAYESYESAAVPQGSRRVLPVRLDARGALARVVRSEVAQNRRVKLDDDASVVLELSMEETHGELVLRGSARGPGRARPTPLTGKLPLADWSSLVPPVLAIFLALMFQRLLLALLAAVYAGAVILAGFDPIAGGVETVHTYLVGNLLDEFNLYIFGFTFSLVGMVSVATRAGGTHGLVEAIRRLARTARSTRVATALMGLAVFFDDYANTVVVGTTMRPLTDKMRISREKLAYLVDSTAAPIAGIALVSTWIGFEVEQFQKLSDFLDLGSNGYALFFQVLPFRFYCMFTVGFVFLSALLARDFGPMLRAERRASATGQALRPGSRPLTSATFQEQGPVEGAPLRWYNAILPVALVLFGVLGGMAWVGSGAPVMEGHGFSVLSLESWRLAFIGVGEIENAGPKILFAAAMAGSLLAGVLAVGQGILTVRESVIAWLTGAQAMLLANGVLLLAWAIRSVSTDLGTPFFLAALLDGLVSPMVIPLLVFVLAAAVAFATGTSWGTMGILLPTVGPMAASLGQPHLLLLSMGAVLDGAIFGDHCSPISDTTVLSSIASGCDHVDHVRTQIPYAVTTMLVAGLAGYLPVAAGAPDWLPYVLGPGVILVVLLGFGRNPDRAQ